MKTVIVIPTYNERENIAALLEAILELDQPVEIVVVDDDSPDKTGEIVREISRREPRVHLLSRMTDKGRGSAGVAGFQWALDQGADYVVEMDGDFSHDPVFIPDLMAQMNSADLVLGSRFLARGADRRGLGRRLLSQLARLYIGLILGVRVSDPTSGYRCFKAQALRALDIRSLKAKGQFIVTEVLYRACRRGLKVREIPIVMKNRQRGQTKLNIRVLLAYCSWVIKLRMTSG